MSPQIFLANTIGKLVIEALAEAQTASVMGITSRGLYLRASKRWVIFITSSRYKGPLTINLDSGTTILDNVTIGMSAHVGDSVLMIPDAGINISLSGSQVWQPVPPHADPLDKAGRMDLLVSYAAYILARKKGIGLSIWLPNLLGLPGGESAPAIGIEIARVDPLRVRRHLNTRDDPALLDALIACLGVGAGLTPSGDDFNIGFLLALNRWGAALNPRVNLTQLNGNIIQAAYQKTTTLSANLIECASHGLADERLIAVIDALVSGAPQSNTPIEALLMWGNSSGLDVFTGFVAALTA